MSYSVELQDCSDELIQKVLGAAFKVHTILGPGLLESIYENALLIELKIQGLKTEQQKTVVVKYREQDLGIGFRADIVVENKLVLELKAIDKFTDLHTAQLITYLKLLGIKRGLLLNFNLMRLKQGIKKVSI